MSKKKIIIIMVVIAFCVISDQLSKWWADNALAIPHPDYSQTLELVVSSEHDGETLEEFLRAELSGTSDEEIDDIASRFALSSDRRRLRPDSILSEGQTIIILRRTITVIDGFWDFRYARNTGAAWSLFADMNETYRRPFFAIVSVIAVVLVFFLVRKVEDKQTGLLFGLALIVGGAVGNLIDRFRFGYVVDFIHWYYKDTHWPTFNIADAAITVGAVLVIYSMLFTMKKKPEEKA